jgi:hypothetical protein
MMSVGNGRFGGSRIQYPRQVPHTVAWSSEFVYVDRVFPGVVAVSPRESTLAIVLTNFRESTLQALIDQTKELLRSLARSAADDDKETAEKMGWSVALSSSPNG